MPTSILALSILTFLPLPFMVAVLLLPGRWQAASKWLVLVASFLQLVVLGVYIWPNCCPAGLPGQDGLGGNYYLLESYDWFQLNMGRMGVLKVDYALGVDGLSLLMIALTPITLLFATVASWNLAEGRKGYFALLLLLNTSLVGCFLALDLFLFYIFYELMLLPMYFLIGIWGGERRQYAAIKFFLYTLLGSVLMLLVIIALHFSYVDPYGTAVLMNMAESRDAVTPEILQSVWEGLKTNRLFPEQEVHTFNLLYLSNPANVKMHSLFSSLDWRLIGFSLLFIAFAIKLPVAPLHTWLPDAHVEASTPISVILAGILLKVGGYGILRVCYGIFPDAAVSLAGTLAWLGVFSIVYGAFLALAQKDLKRLVAYSSVSHMGYVLLGIAALDAASISGAVLQMFNHGIVSGMLFMLVGVLYDRVHDRQIAHFQGLWGKMPIYTAFMLFGCFAGLGLPVMSTFVSEFLVFLGAFGSATKVGLFTWVAVAIGLSGVFLSAVYMLWAFQRMFFGSYAVYGGESWTPKLTDLTAREWVLLVPCVVLILVLGLMPSLALDRIGDWAAHFSATTLEQGRAVITQLGK